ncbi:transcriptional regulator [Alsobacter soli]|uniref:Transcriptional regulator n=1 Tax=Alsobacter soli TaxID=2109933 RepID=A0A2T1HVF8_9HYPH|nr:metalloregulator ArsR/SmtB family transcription factor [Alsobacter soli]PSC05652.1 transcriptional regulator [Alsobacter soli]
MLERDAVPAFAALAQETRLQIVRLLVKAGPDGMAAGALGEAVGATSSRLSFHLKELEHAGLVTSRRQSRSIIYSASFSGLGEVLRFLTEDCCQGHPEVCSPALAGLARCCPEPADA